MRIDLSCLFLLLSANLGWCQLFTPGAGVMDVDGNMYSTIVINNREWMAENLRTSTYADGSVIPNVADSSIWVSATYGMWSYYNNDSLTINPFGKLYNWYSVNDSRNVCPNGWHVPSDVEWKQLLNFLDTTANGGLSPNNAGGLMKSTGTLEAGSGFWNQPNTGASNESGFSGLPGGQLNQDHEFNFLGSFGYFWSSNAIGQSNAIFYVLFAMNANAFRSNFSKTFGLNIRCIKDLTNATLEIQQEEKVLVKVLDVLGREVEEQPNVPLIFIYSDGSHRRVFKLE